jgi:deoxyribodipyrimidine photo-lyase
MTLQILWFKRDLRLVDHAALCAAACVGPVLPLVIVEPEYWQLPDTSKRQWDHWRGCITDLAENVAQAGGTLCVQVGGAVEILEALREKHGAFTLVSHIETGNDWTYTRDKAVAAWCKASGVTWQEHRQFGVLRGAKVNRDRWSAHWDRMMAEPIKPQPETVQWASADTHELPTVDQLGLHDDGLRRVRDHGRAAALADLDTFLTERGKYYTREMSSPITAETACSRMSAHLAYGSLSMREVAQAAWLRYKTLPQSEKHWRQSLRSFIARLHWHCHFIQKLESEPEVEHQPMARIYEGLRPVEADPVRLKAWDEGRTGYPFVDAAMRYLNATGWINFRMRAMLMSFACYDLWLPWQKAGQVLARKFIDYEPGIHWPQCQMQSGETGINTVRIYSPVKQGYDQDPTGVFVRQWVPELADMPASFVHEPWKFGYETCPDYPERLVDHDVASRAAKAAIHDLRKKPEARAEARAVVTKHGSRKGSRDRFVATVRKRAELQKRESAQLDLGL